MKARKKKTAKEDSPPPFPNEFWEHVLHLRATQPGRYKLFSTTLKRSAQIYEQQRDHALKHKVKTATA